MKLLVKDADGKTNLLHETMFVLVLHGKKPRDILWIGNDKVYITWPEFQKAAQDYDYDAGFGRHWINLNLVVVGIDWWLERNESYGAEEWVFKTLPKRPASKGMPAINGRSK